MLTGENIEGTEREILSWKEAEETEYKKRRTGNKASKITKCISFYNYTASDSGKYVLMYSNCSSHIASHISIY